VSSRNNNLAFTWTEKILGFTARISRSLNRFVVVGGRDIYLRALSFAVNFGAAALESSLRRTG
jgi:hypothetical protein